MTYHAFTPHTLTFFSIYHYTPPCYFLLDTKAVILIVDRVDEYSHINNSFLRELVRQTWLAECRVFPDWAFKDTEIVHPCVLFGASSLAQL